MGAQAVRLSNVDIDNALKNKDFEVLFQPIFDLGNGALARMETFVRWRHPKLGVLPPGAFISFFETQGRMSELTRYVLAEALDAYLGWRGPYAPGFSINLALSDLSDEAFASHFAKLLRDREFPADLVTLECPMPTVDADLKATGGNFKRLKETGARLAIEVRGRANDLLRTIDPFPFDEIKTGGSAILRFARTVRGPGLSAISDLLDVANKANAVITAVGVEDQASLSALRGLGFTAAQGNHLAKVGDLKDFRPGRVNEVRELLDLEALDAESLAALFRTEAPAPQAASKEAKPAKAEDPSDALVNRMKERVAQSDAEPETAENAKSAAARTAEDDKKAKAREKAKALALAKRAKAREARKAAAIKRAKAKAAEAMKAANPETKDKQSPFPPSQAPRDMQERLSQEFSGSEKQAEKTSVKAGDKKSAAPNKTENQPGEEEQPAVPAQDDLAEQSAIAQAAPIEKKPVAPSPTEMIAASMAKTEPQQLSLSVGAARAHFQPGIRVGNPALRSDPAPSQPKAFTDPVSPQPQEKTQPTNPGAASSFDAPSELAVEAFESPSAQPEEPVKPFATPPAQPDLEEETAEVEIIRGDLHEDYAEAVHEPEGTDELAAAKTKRRKSFLKRTVIPYPTYFWPKSWKRHFRRMKAKKAAHDALRDAEQAAAD